MHFAAFCFMSFLRLLKTFDEFHTCVTGVYLAILRYNFQGPCKLNSNRPDP